MHHQGSPVLHLPVNLQPVFLNPATSGLSTKTLISLLKHPDPVWLQAAALLVAMLGTSLANIFPASVFWGLGVTWSEPCRYLPAPVLSRHHLLKWAKPESIHGLLHWYSLWIRVSFSIKQRFVQLHSSWLTFWLLDELFLNKVFHSDKWRWFCYIMIYLLHFY